jgi:acyl-CoA reductase-like NAD-dependent aldehyde dehydrogenase
LVDRAVRMGALVHGELSAEQRPVLVTDVTAAMEMARADVFAPLLMLMESPNKTELLNAMEACPYALTAAVFGDEHEALALAESITAGTVLVNDLIAPTADPRVAFGGRRASGFGVTRGTEGLLEMTAVKVVSGRRGKSVRHYEATGPEHVGLFEGVIAASHAGTWVERWRGLKQMVKAARRLK